MGVNTPFPSSFPVFHRQSAGSPNRHSERVEESLSDSSCRAAHPHVIASRGEEIFRFAPWSLSGPCQREHLCRVSTGAGHRLSRPRRCRPRHRGQPPRRMPTATPWSGSCGHTVPAGMIWSGCRDRAVPIVQRRSGTRAHAMRPSHGGVAAPNRSVMPRSGGCGDDAAGSPAHLPGHSKPCRYMSLHRST